MREWPKALFSVGGHIPVVAHDGPKVNVVV
jgi:hypothetical protein